MRVCVYVFVCAFFCIDEGGISCGGCGCGSWVSDVHYDPPRCGWAMTVVAVAAACPFDLVGKERGSAR